MNYQPPLIGSKQLLNFTATSWPAPAPTLLGGGVAARRSAPCSSSGGASLAVAQRSHRPRSLAHGVA